MIITKEQFANVSRRVVFDYITDKCEKTRPSIVLEERTILILTTMIFEGRKKLFGDDKDNCEKDLGRHEIIKALAEACAEEEKVRPIAGLLPTLAVIETLEQRLISSRIVEKLFKKEESNGNREDN